MSATGKTVGLAEWITDDTYLVHNTLLGRQIQGMTKEFDTRWTVTT